ncbi:hypothetical protein PIB30_090234 [Stylosanthes scabra]|uniref:Retrotransposon gag domain-containing protein n=1 Tax=Stylosanthes scabra TaxID=79078 RepID=A0ABU6UTI6_9FABA|nr:hypothetical protein [Stylosanthes scabra]
MANQDEEGVVYTDHSDDDRRRDPQREWSDLPTIRRNRIGRIPDRPRTQTSYAIDGTGSSGIEEGKCRTSDHHAKSTVVWTNSSQTTKTQRPHTPPRRRRLHSNSDDSESSSGRDRNGGRRTYRRYKKTRGRDVTPPIDGHTPFSSWILKVDEVKCRAFPTTLTGLASQWFISLPAGSISSYSEIKELFLNEFTTSIDNTKHPINLLVVVQKPNETTRKYIECFKAECKTIDGLVDGVASLCLTNDLANDEFRKQLMTKPVWTRKKCKSSPKNSSTGRRSIGW